LLRLLGTCCAAMKIAIDVASVPPTQNGSIRSAKSSRLGSAAIAAKSELSSRVVTMPRPVLAGPRGAIPADPGRGCHTPRRRHRELCRQSSRHTRRERTMNDWIQQGLADTRKRNADIERSLRDCRKQQIALESE